MTLMATTSRLRSLTAVLLALSVTLSGCATATGPRVAPSVSGQSEQPRPEVFAEFVRKLPPGAAIRVERTDGRSLRGTLMQASDHGLVLQPRTRRPEPPVEIPYASVARVTPETGSGSNLGKAIGIGAAAGAGAALGVFLIILAIFND